MSHVTPDANAPAAPIISFDEWLKADVRIGTISQASVFAAARKPSLKLVIDFGPIIGFRTSSAQITRHYDVVALVGRQVIAVVNFPPRQIGKFMSEVLTLGIPDADGEVVLLRPDQPVANGGRLF
jgi:tRNA-binding protein